MSEFTTFDSQSLTQSQLAIWTGQKMAPDSCANNLPHIFELKGKIDPILFKDAFQGLIQSQEIFRTVFLENEDGEVIQQIQKTTSDQLELVRINEGELDSYLKNQINKSFDLSRCCFDSSLIAIDENRWIWYLSMHHIVADASTFKVLFNEMAGRYFALLNQIPLAPYQAASFQEFRAYESKQEAGSYWDLKAQEPVNTPQLYGNSAHKGKKSARRVQLLLTETDKKQLQEKLSSETYRAFNQDLAQYTLWTSLFAAFIAKTSGESRIRLGSPYPNRNLQKFKQTAGLLIEVLPLDLFIDENETFQSLFLKVKNELFDFFKYGQAGAQSPENSRGIHFVVNFIPLHFGNFGDIECNTQWLFPDQLDSVHHMRLQIFDFNDATNKNYYLEINEEHLTESQANLIPLHFQNLLQAFLANDQSSLDEINLITKQEIQETLHEKPESEEFQPESLVLQLRKGFELNSKNIAIRCGDETLSYAQLEHKIKAQCNILANQGLGEGSILAIHQPRSVEFLLTVLASIRLGIVFVPIPVDLPPKRIELILGELKPDAVVTNGLGFAHSYLTIGSESPRPVEVQSSAELSPHAADRLAYILFTSGSTGKPKGVEVSLPALSNYIAQAKSIYQVEQKMVMPFFTSIGFDLTITSLFLPLVCGGEIVIFPEKKTGPDLAVLEIFKNKDLTTVKLTPSHARLILDYQLKESAVSTLILGGENLESQLAEELQQTFAPGLRIFNEYGPTEATVGCIVHQYTQKESALHSVPIGKPILGCEAYLLDRNLRPVSQGLPGELFLSGKVLARGYAKRPDLTKSYFLENPFQAGQVMYKTGDMARLNSSGNFEYLGRLDEQLKINGVRIESGEIEKLLNEVPGIEEVHLAVARSNEDQYHHPEYYCKNCGLPSNYPDASFNENGICSLCESFEDYQRNVSSYFKSYDSLKSEIVALGQGRDAKYDCLMLLSGGKDSSYALAKLKELGLNILAFTLDNGFISDHAKQNIRNTTEKLGVDHIYGRTSAMNAIFRDSIERHQNVCNGCFKTVYTLSTQVALEKNIPVIVTGLSRGQFFETRLTEELFIKENFDPKDIDQIILEARKSYHRTKDAVSQYLDVSMFESDEIFDKVAFLDFYRFSDVSLSELIAYLESHIGWKRPQDTGRSTNCIINDLGIYVHKRRKGYHNYAFPYSWDVRVGHKKREETIHELNDHLSIAEIKNLMQEIGYDPRENSQELRAYFKANQSVQIDQIVSHLRSHLPTTMIPSYFQQVDSFPLSPNGKVDKKALVKERVKLSKSDTEVVQKPKNKIEQLIHDTYSAVLKLEAIDVTDSFISLGGNSLAAIRIVSLLGKKLNLDISIQTFFEKDSIRELADEVTLEIKKRLGKA
ncbi:amino acid adenylation domain-containing protein [Algoriphagus halophytocola]|uniref:Amino acid adenylation domain-containing protein n=1 Tax=Algoriphagus halophytocola TaxID=2991499 RepID=A0ABY6MK73_9BACT|nr:MULTISPECIES: amino acid adenylation domain-containing protein [unclassified Algoriphagus]UZD23485.1 amino acid adenylation domain-containing protein [Algoriphagus sp. TR-M5]WBL44779.1 amino acid adenylation domain-containing protein [Algoriphagus sp. TR-M9]